MAKTMLRFGLSSIILVVTMALLTVSPVYATNIWMSVTPGNQTVNLTAVWSPVYEGKEAGCPERNLKIQVQYGDYYSSELYNVYACQPYYFAHSYSSSGNKTQSWFGGQGTGSWIYQFHTYVHRN